MSTLRDLRETLDERAATVDDPDRYARPVAVRTRIRAARQRRAATVGVAAALVLAVGATAVGNLGGGPHRVEPADTVVGIDVPTEVSIHGFPYELTGTDPFEGPDDRIRIAEDQPQAVTLAARDLGAGSATLYLDDVAVARVSAGGASDPVTVGDGGLLRVRFDGTGGGARAGLAFYTGTGELAPGVVDTDDDVVFRDDVGSATRLDAAFGRAGEVELPYDGALSDLRIVTSCADAPRGAYLPVDIDGDPWSVGPCARRSESDPAGSDLDGPGDFAPGQRHTVRAVLTDGRDGPVLEDATVGLGLYAMEVTTVGGVDVASRLEMYGRTWALDPVGTTTLRGIDSWQRTLDADESDLLIGVAGRADGLLRLDWEGRLTQGGSSYIEAIWGASTEGGLLLQGDSYDVRITGDGVRTATLVVYRPV